MLLEVARDGGGHRGHRRRLVPEVRVRGAVRQAEQLLHVDHLPAGVGAAVSIVVMPMCRSPRRSARRAGRR